ncbi:hypothetical protein ABBQ32_010134 [Trebouxia sp. C0010 RCD-2024]
MTASETTSSKLALADIKVYVSHRISHRAAKIKRWQSLLPGLGAELLENPSPAVTHFVASDTTSPQDENTTSKACQVTVAWLEQCLALQKRLPETDAGNLHQTQPTARAVANPAKQPAIELTEVQQALLSVTAGERPPPWMNTQGRHASVPVVVLMVPGLDQQLFLKQQKLLVEMTKCLGTSVPVKAKHFSVHPGVAHTVCVVQASGSFLTVTASILPISRKRKRDSDSHCNDFGTLTATNAAEAQNLPAGTCTATASAADVETSAPPTGTCDLPANTLTASSPKIGSPQSPAAPPFPLEHYEATIAQMQAANYPLPLSATGQKFLPLGFVASHESGEKGSQHQRMVAVDCEMCYTRNALELTRVTLIDENEQVLLDELVLPDTPIVNYNTSFSGISPAMMKGVTTTLTQMQQRILQYVGPDTFVVGHSLENDLRVLKLVHLKVLDTAIMYPHARWPVQQNSLRWLAGKYLGETIQTGSHDSKEDAVTALRLVNLKLQHSPFFGKSSVADAQNLVDVLHEQGRKCVMLDRPEVLAWHASPTCKTTACLADEQAVAQASLCIQEGSADVIWLQLWALADLYEDKAYLQHALHKWPYPKEAMLQKAGKGSTEERLRLTDAHVKQLYHALPSGSMLLVVTGQGDTTQQRYKEERAKEARHARQLAEATGAKPVGQGNSNYSRDSATPSNTLCLCAIK